MKVLRKVYKTFRKGEERKFRSYLNNYSDCIKKIKINKNKINVMDTSEFLSYYQDLKDLLLNISYLVKYQQINVCDKDHIMGEYNIALSKKDINNLDLLERFLEIRKDFINSFKTKYEAIEEFSSYLENVYNQIKPLLKITNPNADSKKLILNNEDEDYYINQYLAEKIKFVKAQATDFDNDFQNMVKTSDLKYEYLLKNINDETIDFEFEILLLESQMKIFLLNEFFDNEFKPNYKNRLLKLSNCFRYVNEASKLYAFLNSRTDTNIVIEDLIFKFTKTKTDKITKIRLIRMKKCKSYL